MNLSGHAQNRAKPNLKSPLTRNYAPASLLTCVSGVSSVQYVLLKRGNGALMAKFCSKNGEVPPVSFISLRHKLKILSEMHIEFEFHSL